MHYWDDIRSIPNDESKKKSPQNSAIRWAAEEKLNEY